MLTHFLRRKRSGVLTPPADDPARVIHGQAACFWWIRAWWHTLHLLGGATCLTPRWPDDLPTSNSELARGRPSVTRPAPLPGPSARGARPRSQGDSSRAERIQWWHKKSTPQKSLQISVACSNGFSVACSNGCSLFQWISTGVLRCQKWCTLSLRRLSV